MNFLQLLFTPPADNLLYVGHYNPFMVAISVTAAVVASYVCFLLADMASESADAARRTLSLLGGVCMGFGIWGMHFIGMMAFTLPCTTSYNPYITLFSILPAILASVFAFNIISHKAISPLNLLGSAVLFGAGIGAMHYSGMAAMGIQGLIQYDFWLFLLSIVVAVAMALLALWTKFQLQNRSAIQALVVGSIVMGLAVSVMHYTAMAATYFVRDSANVSEVHPALSALLASLIEVLPIN